jgi:uncharacterized protein YutD
MMNTLIINNVDFDLLEKQRLLLAEVVQTTPFKQKYDDALNGILLMLDGWSDEQLRLKKFVDEPGTMQVDIEADKAAMELCPYCEHRCFDGQGCDEWNAAGFND